MTDAFSHHEVLCNHICNSLKQLTEFWPDLWHVQKALFEKKLKVRFEYCQISCWNHKLVVIGKVLLKIFKDYLFKFVLSAKHELIRH